MIERRTSNIQLSMSNWGIALLYLFHWKQAVALHAIINTLKHHF